MRLRLLCFLFAQIVGAIFQDEAGKIDIHIPLIGNVLQTFIHEPIPGHGSICIAHSDRHILAGLNCRSGDIVWRNQLSPEDAIPTLFTSGSNVYTLTNSGALVAWSAQTGNALWSINDSHSQIEAHLSINEALESIFLLTGDTLRRLSIPEGNIAWEMSLDLAANVSRKITSNADAVYMITSMISSDSTRNELSVTQIDTATGKSLGATLVGTLLKSTSFDNVHLSGDGTTPMLTWLEDTSGVIVLNILGHKKHIELVSERTFDRFSIQYEMLPGSAVILVEYTNAGVSTGADIYSVDVSTLSVQNKYSIPATSLPSLTKFAKWQDQIYVVRVHQDIPTGHVEIWNSVSHGRLASYAISNATSQGSLQSFSVEVSHDSATNAILARAMVSTSDGLVSMWRGSSVDWTRDEGLADVKCLILVELPEAASLQATAQLERDPFGNFISRAKRHLAETISLLIESDPAEGSRTHDLPQRDHFGLRQYAIALGKSGRFWAIDTLGPQTIAWTSTLSTRDAVFVDAWLHGVDNDTDAASPKVDMLIRRHEDHFIVQIDVLTGLELSVRPMAGIDRTSSSNLSGKVVNIKVSANSVDAVVVQDEKMIGSWVFEPPPGQRIVAESKLVASEPVASVGRVLGDRGVLYKYLSRESIAILTIDDVAQTLSIWYLDAVTGSIVYKAIHHDVGTDQPVQVLIAENWIVYHFWKEGDIKAYEMVIVELYEGPRNSRKAPDEGIFGIAQSFIYDHAISTMAATTSKQGITSRDIVVALQSNEITAISRRLLDPRRPTDEKLSADDKEEMLIPYNSLIFNDPKAVLSHNREVIGINRIVTGPTLLESTALVCGFGLDIFFTRVTPSMPYDILSDSFSKSQIGISLFVLCAAIAFTRPMAAKKGLERRWIG